jgi:hypothetical protein
MSTRGGISGYQGERGVFGHITIYNPFETRGGGPCSTKAMQE